MPHSQCTHPHSCKRTAAVCIIQLVLACMLTSCQVPAARSTCTSPLPFCQARFVRPLQANPLRSYQRRIDRLGVAQAPLVVSPQQVVPCHHHLLAEAQEVWTSPIGTAAVLIVDATNRASVSAADARAYKHAGATLHGTFEAWLVYLHNLLQPELCIAVFDPPQVNTHMLLPRPTSEQLTVHP